MDAKRQGLDRRKSRARWQRNCVQSRGYGLHRLHPDVQTFIQREHPEDVFLAAAAIGASRQQRLPG